MSQPIELPLYQCHKQVRAMKIKEIGQASAERPAQFAGGDWLLFPEDDKQGPVRVGHDQFVLKHKPHAGGYYVVYEDGYESFSPAQAFEAGYSLVAVDGAEVAKDPVEGGEPPAPAPVTPPPQAKKSRAK